jgi:hypothetical protein
MAKRRPEKDERQPLDRKAFYIDADTNTLYVGQGRTPNERMDY